MSATNPLGQGGAPPGPSSSSGSPTSGSGASSSRILSPAAAAALAAAEARARPPPRTSSQADAHSLALDVDGAFAPSRVDLQPFYRLLDSKLLPNVSKPQAVTTLSTLHTLLQNILAPPNPSQAAKYRQLRFSNKLIAREVVLPANGAAKEYLVLCGFRKAVRDFEEHLEWHRGEGGTQLFKLRCGKKVLETRMAQAKEAEEREKRYRESEKGAEAARKERALLGFEEDRLDRAARDERERLVREARAAEPQTAPAPYSTGPSSFARQAGRTTARMGRGFSRAGAAAFGDEEEAEEDDDEHEDGTGEDDGAVDDDAPPSYGELHGRVLGTGLPPGGEAAPPAGVSMVNAQDLDEAE
ncbi:hypothetical protein DMC30DRAFT_389119 [Rhodotorula diobovata]|uniref:PUB domain-containing protein n=1 Tax=Rhodotorula diobovata TaxID=5288 RepID=A0A5C5G587_9BASI|nr:hypothetical protein DMC30DRAFT_389119 [Rhodotorula diobovata]